MIPSLSMGRFSCFFTHRTMFLIWNHGLIRFLNSCREPWLSIREWPAIPKYLARVINFVEFLYSTQPKSKL